MISKKMEAALNAQLNMELYSAYTYAALAAHFDTLDLDGFKHWMLVQAKEELAHAAKFYTFIMDAGGVVTLDTIKKPTDKHKAPLAVFEAVYKHECEVSRSIHELVDLANAEHHHPSHTFLQWFVSEQVEEERTADHIVKTLRMVGDNPNGLFLVDREMAQRSAAADAASASE